MKNLLRILFLLVISTQAFAQNDKGIEKKIKYLDNYYEQSLKDYNVPGMAVAIVKDGKVIFSKGYGVRNVDTGEPVDGNTLFAIASNTKSFTAASLAMMVDEGKLKWDDKVEDYLPWFRLYAPYVSENFTIRDLLCHRSGLATFSGDLIWYGTDLSTEQVVRNARFLKPVYGFRAHYGYSNIMFMAAGLVLEKVSGRSWTDFVTQRLIKPLHMDRSLTSTKQLPGVEDVSAPHNDFNDGLITIPWLNWDNIQAAGGIISSVNDLSKWLIFQMNQGVTAEGDTLLSAARFHDMWAANTIENVSAGAEKRWPSTHFKAYGLGWGTFDYLGRKIIGHGGGYDGFITNTTFIPEENLGFIILTNKNTSLYYPLMYKTLDVFLGNKEETDWSKMILDLINKRDEMDKKAEEKAEAERNKDSQPTLPQDAYLGTYNCEMYGDAKVYMEEGQMKVHLMPTEIFVGDLTHWEYNTWQIEFKKVPSLPKGKVNFTIDENGKVTDMLIDVPNPDFDFTELKFHKTM